MNRAIKKMTVVVTALAMMISVGAINGASAADVRKFEDIETLSYSDREDLTFNICKAIAAADSASLKNFADYFEPECYAYIVREVGDVRGGNIISYVNDYIKPQNSSNGDYVTLSNLMLMYNNDKHAMCVELHYNKDGKIYGYNFWQY